MSSRLKSCRREYAHLQGQTNTLVMKMNALKITAFVLRKELLLSTTSMRDTGASKESFSDAYSSVLGVKEAILSYIYWWQWNRNHNSCWKRKVIDLGDVNRGPRQSRNEYLNIQKICKIGWNSLRIRKTYKVETKNGEIFRTH